MTAILSNGNLEVVIDQSHRIEGWAAVDRPAEFPDVGDRFTLQRSQNDGGLYIMANMILGGDFVIRLAPTSPSAQWLIDRGQEIKRAQRQRQRIRIFSITYDDVVQGRSTVMEGCVMYKFPDQVEANETAEFTFACEVIDTNNDGAIFTPPLETRLFA